MGSKFMTKEKKGEEMLRKSIVSAAVFALVIMATGLSLAEETYEPTWRSLKRYPVPQWVKDGKFGIYTHWGVYSVPAMGGPDGTSYPATCIVKIPNCINTM